LTGLGATVSSAERPFLEDAMERLHPSGADGETRIIRVDAVVVTASSAD
jgi:hypothetical protein